MHYMSCFSTEMHQWIALKLKCRFGLDQCHDFLFDERPYRDLHSAAEIIILTEPFTLVCLELGLDEVYTGAWGLCNNRIDMIDECSAGGDLG